MKPIYLAISLLVMVTAGCQPTTAISNVPTTPPTPTIPTPTAATPTAVPLADDDPFWSDLRSKQYELIFSTSHANPDGFTYSAYAFKDTQLQPELGGATNPEICRIAFYRWDGKNNVLMTSLGAPTYPATSRYGGFPVNCSLANWDDDLWFTDKWGPNMPLNVIRSTLGLQGYWSDINQNGLPEVGVLHWYCPNACHGYEGAVHFYEIQAPASVIDLTANLAGVILPWKFLHSTDPVTLYVFDPSLEYEPHTYIDSWWIYGWNGTAFVDVASQFANEYQDQAESLMAKVQAAYGKPFASTGARTELDTLGILFTLDKAGLRQQALEDFLEVTDLSNWPGSDVYYSCWLQLIRAIAQEDYDNGRSFTLPPSSSYDFQLAAEAEKLDQSTYDLSACRTLKP